MKPKKTEPEVIVRVRFLRDLPPHKAGAEAEMPEAEAQILPSDAANIIGNPQSATTAAGLPANPQ